MPESFEIVRSEAAYWWRTNVAAGAVLDRMMWLFIFVPFVLVANGYYAISFLVFLGMIPYGFFLRYLAGRSVVAIIESNPETMEEFEDQGVIRR